MMKSPYSRQSPQRTPQQRMATTAEKKQVMVLRVHYFDTAPNVGGIEDEEMAFIKNGLADSGKTSENLIMCTSHVRTILLRKKCMCSYSN